MEFVTSLAGAAELYPILPTRRFIPAWWKQMKVKSEGVPSYEPGTMKTCPAILDVLKSGWIMQTCVDALITSEDDTSIRWVTASGGPILIEHPALQSPGMPQVPGLSPTALKFDKVWACRTPPGYSLRIGNVPLEYDAPFDVFPAIVDTDYHPNLIPVFRYRWMGRGERMIPAGTPLCLLTLVRREDEATFRADCVHDEARFREMTAGAMGAVGHGLRLVRGGYQARGRRWRHENGVRY